MIEARRAEQLRIAVQTALLVRQSDSVALNNTNDINKRKRMGSLVELSDSSNTCILAVTLPAGWQHTSPVHAVPLPAGTLESIQKERIDASIRRDWHRLFSSPLFHSYT